MLGHCIIPLLLVACGGAWGPSALAGEAPHVRGNGDLAIGLVETGVLRSVSLSTGFFCRTGLVGERRGALYRDEDYYFLELTLWLGIPGGPWSAKAFDPERGDSIPAGPAVSECVSAQALYGPEGPEWGPVAGSRGKDFSGDLLLGQLYPGEPSYGQLLPVMATSTLPETWPRDAYGLRYWPGRWAKDPAGRPRKGVFPSDRDLFFRFTDKGYATRKFREAVGYETGALVECDVHGFEDSYAGRVIFYELSVINQSEWDYQGVFLGLFFEAGIYLPPPLWRFSGWNALGLLREERLALSDTTYVFDLAYLYKRPEVVAEIRRLVPGAVVGCLGVTLLDTPPTPRGKKAGLTGWHWYQYRLPQGRSYLDRKDRDLVQYKVLSGDTSGLSLELKEAFFIPDPSGVLDPRFDSPEAINARFPEGLEVGSSLMSSGPFDWPSGDTLHLVFALVMGDDLEDLKRNARTARRMYELGYQRSGPPPAPKVYAVPGDRKVTLYWDRRAEEARDAIFGYQDFEGYRIYRTTVDPVEGRWGEEIRDARGKVVGFVPVAQFDLKDGYSGLDPEYPHLDLGRETGVAHSWTDTAVTNGVTYWYSVCAYDRGVRRDSVYNPEGWPAFRSLESARGTDPERDANVVRVVPGVRASTYVGPTVGVMPLPGTLGNGSIGVEVVDELRVSGHTYTMSFEDTSTGRAVYWVYDEDEASWVLQRVGETAGEEGPVFDGLRFWVERFDTVGVWQERSGWYRGESRSPCTWRISGRRVGVPPRADYEIRFQAEEERGYATGKRGPFSVWNVTTGEKVEWDIFYNSPEDTSKEMWERWTSGDRIAVREEVGGKRVITWTFVLSRPKEGQDVPPGVGDVARIVTTKPFRVGDRFSLVTAAVGERRAARDDLARIRVVPNPYVGGAGWEQGGEDRRICFVNVPARCEVRVYTVGGDHVVTLRHDSVERGYCWWDLRN
ncbi:MAG: hypothetical protein ONB30_11800, partial [candidate division KSB1 bacterium]|nr:hypothetical protein [candidate division KSB1 bacterium]